MTLALDIATQRRNLPDEASVKNARQLAIAKIPSLVVLDSARVRNGVAQPPTQGVVELIVSSLVSVFSCRFDGGSALSRSAIIDIRSPRRSASTASCSTSRTSAARALRMMMTHDPARTHNGRPSARVSAFVLL